MAQGFKTWVSQGWLSFMAPVGNRTFRHGPWMNPSISFYLGEILRETLKNLYNIEENFIKNI